MPLGEKLPFGALVRFAGAGAAAFTAAQLTGDSNPAVALGVGLATVATSYFVNRTTATEEQFSSNIRASKNHHLQLALAGSFRIALDNIQRNHPGFETFFHSWQAILEAALDNPDALLAAIVPAEFDPFLDAANPHLDQTCAYEEAELLLRFWLTYQQASERTGSYSAIPPTVSADLPPGLRQILKADLLPEFQNAFANLLSRNLADLHAWLASPAPVSVRILTGPAGSGKTRLAIQFLEELVDSGWDAGFLRESGLADASKRRWDRPTLAIIDYAASAAKSSRKHVAARPWGPSKKRSTC